MIKIKSTFSKIRFVFDFTYSNNIVKYNLKCIYFALQSWKFQFKSFVRRLIPRKFNQYKTLEEVLWRASWDWNDLTTKIWMMSSVLVLMFHALFFISANNYGFTSSTWPHHTVTCTHKTSPKFQSTQARQTNAQQPERKKLFANGLWIWQ